MSIDTNNLRALAQAANTGKRWFRMEMQRMVGPVTEELIAAGGLDPRMAVIDFIEAFDPLTVLSLLDELDKLRALLDTPWVKVTQPSWQSEEMAPRLTASGDITACLRGVWQTWPAEYALALGAALIRAASTEIK